MRLLPLLSFGFLSLLFRFVASVNESGDPCVPSNGYYFSIWNETDIEPLIDCTQINSFIIIDDYPPGVLTLPNLVTAGGLSIDNAASLTVLSLPQLSGVIDQNGSVGEINLHGQSLTTLNLPALIEVGGGGITIDCPSLNNWTGTDSLQSTYELQILRHNINSLSFANLNNVTWPIFINMSSSNDFWHPDTLYLNGKATVDALIIGSNYTNFTSDMENIKSMVVRGCEDITINSRIMGSLEISLNPHLVNVNAPNLLTLGPYVNFATDHSLPGENPAVGDSLLIADNTFDSVLFDQMLFPNLATIQGSLQTMGNTLLPLLTNSFPLLQNVTKDILISGNSEVGHFPSLAFVGGNINFTSSESSLDDCFYFTELYKEGDVKGSLYCTTATNTVNLTHPSPTPSALNHKSKLAKSAMIGIGVGVAVFGFAISGLIVFWMLKSRRW